LCHRTSGFASADHESAALGRIRREGQMGGGVVQGQSALHSHVIKVAQKEHWIVD
jgi:hypothetical protein